MRIFYSILILVLLFTTPYWVYLPLMVIGVVLFPLYIEAIFFGILIDRVYGGPGHFSWVLGLPFSLTALVLVILALPLRESLRFHA